MIATDRNSNECMGVEESRSARVCDTLYMTLFPKEGADEHRRFLLYVVYHTIVQEEGITVNKIKWKLNRDLSFNSDDIDIALHALSNARFFNAISKFHVKARGKHQHKKANENVHLRLRKGNQAVIESWSAELLDKYPEYSSIISA